MKKNGNNNKFKYVIFLAILLIPFIYSFFYLKAYWDPYKEGNIDNLPVAIVNEDDGTKGKELIQNVKDSKKLKLSVLDESEALEGLNNSKYYAIIKIPKDFTKDLESAKKENKSHATITYSSNQKANYLASQIINNVVVNVEKNLDNTVNSEIISELTDTVTKVPDELSTISDGFKKLNEGTKKLSDGTNTLSNSTNSLYSNYDEFNKAIVELQNGTNDLANSTKEFGNLIQSIKILQTGTKSLTENNNNLNNQLDSYLNSIDSTLSYTSLLANYIKSTTCPKVISNIATEEETYLCGISTNLLEPKSDLGNLNAIKYQQVSAEKISSGSKKINQGINTLNTKVSSFSQVEKNLLLLSSGIERLNNGANLLKDNSLKIKNGIYSLNNGTTILKNNTALLNNNVNDAKNKLDKNVSTTKKEITKVESLADYAKEPVNIVNTPINEVSSYGTAFSPFFISIALWVGCLMMYIVLYYDKEERFNTFGINNPNHLKRTLCYHGLITLSSFILALLLQLFLDFEITNIILYYFVIILIGNAFMGIIEFLIVNFKDVGKFIALILLVLQLASSGGTFPIETVTKGFRWLNNFLPMKYTINLLKESLVTIQHDLLIKNILIVFIIFGVFLGINIINDIYVQNKNRKKF